MDQTTIKTGKNTRRFLPCDLVIGQWEDLKTYFEQLDERVLENAADLENFIWDVSEVEAVLEEELGWRYIRMTCDTQNETYARAYQQFIAEIQPHTMAFNDRFNQKIQAFPDKDRLPQFALYKVYFRNLENEIALFREENIPLHTELSEKAQEFGSISGKMEVEVEGESYTMQQASRFMEKTDRALREQVYHSIGQRRLVDRGRLDDLLDELIEKRQQLAKNAGFDNYRDYRFRELGRFDYTPEDCERFHESVRKHFLPLVGQLHEVRKQKLGYDHLRPWDMQVEPEGKPPLEPFSDGKDLLEKGIGVFQRIDPYFGECLKILGNMGHLDLESKKGKAPGGYNYPLYETGVPFIFMNAVGTHDDMITLMHEGGHAVHSFLSRHYKVTGFKDFPSEIAELASMSMELITMGEWGVFYPDTDSLQRAKWGQLERTLEVMPWVALIDRFQHWLYTVPHTREERRLKWRELFEMYRSPVIDYTGLEDYTDFTWHKQLHIFEVPFYYIEYGIAQLGAIGVWRNYLNDNQKALYHFKKALEAGNTDTLPELYAKAKVRFDFSEENMEKLAAFVRGQMKVLEKVG